MAAEIKMNSKDQKMVTHSSTRTLARVVQLYAGLDLMGSKMSLNHKESEIEIYDWGVRVKSKKTKRVIRIYNSNIKGLEELPGSPE